MKIKKLNENAVIPTKAHATDAGYDLYALDDVTVYPVIVKVIYSILHYVLWKLDLAPAPDQILATQIPTGVAIELPENHVALIMDKSGLGRKLLKVFGGVVDFGYTGDVTVQLANFGIIPHSFKAGQKVAQLVIQKVEHLPLEVVDELSNSERGEKGFGSSGQ